MSGFHSPHPALYRAAQFLAAVKAGLPAWAGGTTFPTAPDLALVKAILPTPAQQRLFNQMPPNDRRHALAVVHILRQAGHDHPALLQAGLLHDVGKSLGQPIVHRVLIVLFEAFWPAALRRLSTPGAAGRWRRPFVIHAEHATIGAAWAKESGCETLTVRLIARHQDDLPPRPVTEEDRLLAVLQWADDLN
ncbi:MAG: HD domain-containing protein [Chloroflexota bacterium]